MSDDARNTLADKAEAALDELREDAYPRDALLVRLLAPVATALRREADSQGWLTRDPGWPEFDRLGVPRCPSCDVLMEHEDSWGEEGVCAGVRFWCSCGRRVQLAFDRPTTPGAGS